MMLTTLLLAIAGVVIAVTVGTFWYSTATPMGRLHMRYLGFDKLSKEQQLQKIEEAKPKMPIIYAAQMALSFLTSFFVVFVITMSVENGVPVLTAIMYPLMGWLCFVVPTVGSSILWGNCDPAIAWKKFFSEIGCVLVTILLIAFLTMLFL